jgi:hypothetical protein
LDEGERDERGNAQYRRGDEDHAELKYVPTNPMIAAVNAWPPAAKR